MLLIILPSKETVFRTISNIFDAIGFQKYFEAFKHKYCTETKIRL